MIIDEINVAWSSHKRFDMEMRLVLVSERFLAFVQVEISENINWRNENNEDAINSGKVI